MEPLLDPQNRRFTVYPLDPKYTRIWELYQQQLSAFWKAQEVDFSKDYEDFQTLSPQEQHFIKSILAFFANSDGIVNFNLSTRFLQDIQIMEVLNCYSFQMVMENIHGESYSLMLDNLVRDPQEKQTLFNAFKTVNSIKMLSDWAFKWIDSSESFAKRLVAFAVVEGVIFSGAFASIFWLKYRKSNGRLFLSGLIKSNEFIARDEGLHTTFACELYKHLENKLTREEIVAIIRDGVDCTLEFMTDALPVKLLGMNNSDMCQYIQYVADRLITQLGYQPEWNVQNPFDFMEAIGMTSKTNFFESRPTEYQSAYVFNQNSKLEILEDF